MGPFLMEQTMRSVMQHQFSQVPRADIPRSSFNRSHGYKTTLDAGYLVPIFIDEAIPGDTFNLKLNAFARLATPLHPIMDNMFMDCFFFAVPKRLVWDNFQKFMGEQENPEDTTDYIEPVMAAPEGGYLVGSLSDYFGIPTEVTGLEHISAFHRAYNLIWNQWFRDQNLQDSVPVSKADSNDSPANYVLLRRGKRHDYFTSALPWPQKGPAVQMPVGGLAPVIGDIGPINITIPGQNTQIRSAASGGGSVHTMSRSGTGAGALPLDLSGVTSTAVHPWAPGQILETGTAEFDLLANLGEATAASINVIRQAFQIQKILERDARGGTRYTELIHAHFGVTSPDARLQRPEYLGGGSVPVNVSPIAQTSSVPSQPTPQGNLAAIGTVNLQGIGFTKSFTEHCVIIGLVSVRADLTYQQGLDRMFSRSTRFDHYWPALSHIGEQTVLNKEIYAQGPAVLDENDDPIDNNVFGYQERYAEYRYKPSKITGKFRSTFAQTLHTWHLSQDFDTLPVLDSDFIEDNPPIERVIAVQTEPHFLYDSYIELHCARPMPVYSVPGLIDHF